MMSVKHFIHRAGMLEDSIGGWCPIYDIRGRGGLGYHQHSIIGGTIRGGSGNKAIMDITEEPDIITVKNAGGPQTPVEIDLTIEELEKLLPRNYAEYNSYIDTNATDGSVIEGLITKAEKEKIQYIKDNPKHKGKTIKKIGEKIELMNEYVKKIDTIADQIKKLEEEKDRQEAHIAHIKKLNDEIAAKEAEEAHKAKSKMPASRDPSTKTALTTTAPRATTPPRVAVDPGAISSPTARTRKTRKTTRATTPPPRAITPPPIPATVATYDEAKINATITELEDILDELKGVIRVFNKNVPTALKGKWFDNLSIDWGKNIEKIQEIFDKTETEDDILDEIYNTDVLNLPDTNKNARNTLKEIYKEYIMIKKINPDFELIPQMLLWTHSILTNYIKDTIPEQIRELNQLKIDEANRIAVLTATSKKIKKDRYIPSVAREPVGEIDIGTLTYLKSKKLDVSIIGQDYKHIITDVNASLNNPYSLITSNSLNKIYPPSHPTKFKKDIIMNPKIQQFYDTVNYEPGKDFEDLFTKNIPAVKELIRHMGRKLTPRQIQDLTPEQIKQFIVNSDDIWNTAGHTKIGEYFTYDAFINIVLRGVLTESFCIEFKKYAMYAHYGYLSELKEESKKYFDNYFYQYYKKILKLQEKAEIGDTDALGELHFELDRIKGTNDKIDNVKLWADYSAVQKIAGIPVKFTKFNILTDALIDTEYLVNTEEAAEHFLTIAKNGQFLVTLGPNSGASNIIWSADTPKRAEFSKIIQDHLLKTGQESDIIFVIGLFDAILICNISQRMRDGYIIGHPFNSLQVALSAYEKSGDLTTWDHYLIPIEWFYSINLD